MKTMETINVKTRLLPPNLILCSSRRIDEEYRSILKMPRVERDMIYDKGKECP